MTDLNKQVVSFGEVLWDVYPEGKKLGGAPFNVAAHLTKLGTQGHIVTKVGMDTLGEEILTAIQDQNIETNYTQIDFNFQTGTVDVTLDKFGQPTYDIKKPVAWDFIHANLENLNLVQNCDGLIYGSLACRSERNIQTLKDLTDISPLNICDLNIRQNFYSKEILETLLTYSNILKVNIDEADLLSSFFNLDNQTFYQALSDRFGIDLIIKTVGADGAEAYHEGQVFRTKSVKVKVIDTVGAGDAFLAAFVHHYLHGENIKTCLREGAKLGGFVATQSGAIPAHSFENITV